MIPQYLFDMPLEELESCTLPQEKPADLDAFWTTTLERNANQPLEGAACPLAYSVPDVRVDEIAFNAFDGGRINGWFLTPTRGDGPFPTLIFHHGYGWNRGKIADYLIWALQGFPASRWMCGDKPARALIGPIIPAAIRLCGCRKESLNRKRII